MAAGWLSFLGHLIRFGKLRSELPDRDAQVPGRGRIWSWQRLVTSRRKISELWAYARIAFSAENCKVERIWH
jgi:hypothetical protein